VSIAAVATPLRTVRRQLLPGSLSRGSAWPVERLEALPVLQPLPVVLLAPRARSAGAVLGRSPAVRRRRSRVQTLRRILSLIRVLILAWKSEDGGVVLGFLSSQHLSPYANLSCFPEIFASRTSSWKYPSRLARRNLRTSSSFNDLPTIASNSFLLIFS